MRIGQLSHEAARRTRVQRAVRGGDIHGSATAARAVLRIPARARTRTDALSGRLRAAGLVERRALPAAAGVPRPRLRSGAQRDPPAPPDAAALPRSRGAAQPASA